MVDAIVSPLLKQLLSTAVEETKQQVQLVVGVDQELRKLTRHFQAIHAVLVDAEQRQVKEESVRLWLDHLRDASYYMEDVLDEWTTARLKLQADDDDDDVDVDTWFATLMKKVCSFFPSSCFGFKQVIIRHDIALKIKEISAKLDDIAQQKDMFDFNVNAVKGIEKSDRVPSISLVDESEISGRVMEKDVLISKLVCESSSEQSQKGLHIISLVGMGGIGKTTLAQLAYNNNEVKRIFEKIIWVCVSDPFDEFRVARAIFEALDNSVTNLSELQSLMQHIHKSIEGKKFLLVLDDVWTENYSKLEPFYHCLKNGLYGSKILITTRKESVALKMRSSHIFNVKELSLEENWSLLRQFAFFNRPSRECEELEEIGRKIVVKCKGLPLAAKTIGSLLRFKKTAEEWQSILDSEMWQIEELDESVFGPLLLSYNDLPSRIKRCFSYCAVFPKDDIINRDKLVQLWMAQGYLLRKENKEMETIGVEYFDYLVARSFFQELEKDDDGIVTNCKIHDIVHDFAQFLCKNECFTVDVHGLEESFVDSFHERVCHSTLMFGEGASFPVSICKLKRLRSLFVNGKGGDSSSLQVILPNSFGELKSLRAVEYRYPIAIKEIPEEIGKLVLLRYLNLSCQWIRKLPDTLCELYNLQTLDITSCEDLFELPQGIGKLINLRNLLNGGNSSLSYMPEGFGRLTRLRTLKIFPVDGGVPGGKACKLEALKKLHLSGDCEIRGLGNVSDVGEVKGLRLLQNMENLFDLTLAFGRGERMEEDDEMLIETLQPPQNVKKLSIWGYIGNTFSLSWMMSLTNVRHLSINTCWNCKHLPPLGKLPALERLSIWRLPSVERLGNDFFGIESDRASSSSSSIISFPSLKELEIARMLLLAELDYEIRADGEEEIRILPCFSSLTIHRCTRMKALPHFLCKMRTLLHLAVVKSHNLERRCRKETGEDWHMISHIPNIRIGFEYLQGGP